MQTKIFSLFSAALLIGGLAGCSSSEDAIDNPVPTAVSENAVGQAIDDVTAEMQSTIYNCATSGTRAQSDIDAIIKEIPTVPEVFFNNAVPGDAKDVKTNSQIWLAGGPWYVAKGESYTLTRDFNLTNTTMYVSGTLTLESSWTDANKTKIIVKDGGTLIVKTNGSNILGSGGSIYVEKGGTLTVPDGATLNVDQNSKVYVEDGNISAKRIIVQGTLYVNGDLKAESFNVDQNSKVYVVDGNISAKRIIVQGTLYVNGDLTAKNFTGPMNDKTRLYVAGKLTSTDADLTTDGYIRVDGGIDAGNHDIYFQNTTKLLAQCGIKASKIDVNSNAVEVHANYIKCDNLYQCAASKIFLEDKGFIDVNDTYTNQNNGTAAIIMEGKNAMGVLKATTIVFNGSTSKDIFFAKTNPDEGKQCLGIDCNNYKYDQNNGNFTTLEFNDINFVKGEVERIAEGKVVDNDRQTTSDVVAYSIPKDECHGNGYQPDKPVNPDTPKPIIVAESHTHDISATCVQTDGTNVYVSYHQRGKTHSGCIEMLTTTGNITTLKQFVRDHEKAIDFNHIALDKANKHLYAVGNNKDGGFLGFLRLKDDGTIDCASQKMDGLDSIEIAHKNYLPLQIVKLWEAQLASKKGGKGGDGNCVIVNGNDLDVASTYGYEVFDNTLAELRATKTAGRAKHLAYAPDGKTFYAIHYDGTQIVDSMTEVGLKLEKFNTSDVNMESPLFTVDANKVKPNNGKNAMCVFDGKVYVCQSMNGLYVYDANSGTQVGHYKENIVSSQTHKELAICANGVAVDANYVYIAYGTRGLVVLDRNTLKKVTSFVGQRSANYVALANGYIYVAYGRDSLKVFKMSK